VTRAGAKRWSAWLVGALVLTSCGRDASRGIADGSVAVDSAGIRIVTQRGADVALALRVDTIGVLADSLGAPAELDALGPRSVAVVPGGAVAVLQRSEPYVWIFGPDGTLHRQFGRQGGAPGELQFPRSISASGDTVEVVDRRRGAIVRWTANGTAVADRPLVGALAGVWATAVQPNGLLIESRGTDAGGGAMHELGVLGQAPIRRLVNPTPRQLSVCGGQVSFSMPAFFAPSLLWHANPSYLAVSAEADFQIERRDSQGGRLIVRRALAPRRPDVEDLRAVYPEGLRVGFGEAPCTLTPEQLVSEVGLADVLPPVTGLFVTSSGRLFVRRSRGTEPERVDHFAEDGRYLGTTLGVGLPLAEPSEGVYLVSQPDSATGLTRAWLVRMRN
jgi:hypothetical protein